MHKSVRCYHHRQICAIMFGGIQMYLFLGNYLNKPKLKCAY